MERANDSRNRYTKAAAWRNANEFRHSLPRAPSGWLAEREGFEPSVPVTQYARLAIWCLRPLGHLSAHYNQILTRYSPLEQPLQPSKNFIRNPASRRRAPKLLIETHEPEVRAPPILIPSRDCGTWLEASGQRMPAGVLIGVFAVIRFIPGELSPERRGKKVGSPVNCGTIDAPNHAEKIRTQTRWRFEPEWMQALTNARPDVRSWW
jgi:hypothetical protein